MQIVKISHFFDFVNYFFYYNDFVVDKKWDLIQKNTLNIFVILNGHSCAVFCSM